MSRHHTTPALPVRAKVSVNGLLLKALQSHISRTNKYFPKTLKSICRSTMILTHLLSRARPAPFMGLSPTSARPAHQMAPTKAKSSSQSESLFSTHVSSLWVCHSTASLLTLLLSSSYSGTCTPVNDRLSFCETYAHSIEHREDLHFYARLFCKSDTFTHMSVASLSPNKEALLEIMGYPYFVLGESAYRCFFAVAKPILSRNTAI